MPDREQVVSRYRVPAGEAHAELIAKNSTFIGSAGPAPSVEAAHAYVAAVRAAYPDANHHAWAFKVGGGSAAVTGSSDDGEPGGTAGRPMLAILEGSGLRDVVVVGTRYFGGIKLGTGGLVRAYSGAAREALRNLPTCELELYLLARISVDYALYGHLQYLMPRQRAKIVDASFAERVALSLAVPYEHAEEVAAILSELTGGALILQDHWTGERYDPVES
ncbi:MAG: IMPACT family protein [Anaerolineae bacterium]